MIAESLDLRAVIVVAMAPPYLALRGAGADGFGLVSRALAADGVAGRFGGFRGGQRLGLGMAALRAIPPAAATLAASARRARALVVAPAATFLAWLAGRQGVEARALERDALAGQLLDGGDELVVMAGDDREGGAFATGSAGAADAMDVVLGMGRNIEIEDVADRGDVQAAGGDIGRDKDRILAGAEGFERRHARVLVHVPVQGDGRKAMLLQ